MFECALGFLWAINNSTPEAIHQRTGGGINHDYFGSALDEPVRHSFADPYTGDAEDVVVQALEVLDIHVGHDVNACVQEHLNIFPTLSPWRARNICVCEFIHDTNGRLPLQDG